MAATSFEDLDDKHAHLRGLLTGYGSVAVGYSGGVDSTYLLAAAVDALGADAVGVTAVSPSLPAAERQAAVAVASDLGARHVELRTDEVERAAYRRNDRERCFHCKTALFDVLEPYAAAEGIAVLALGVVTDDLGEHRPGQRAARERGVRTPLADTGLSKAEVRELSRRRGLPTWDKPAAACLASRVAYGIEVDAERLGRVEAAEGWLRARLGPWANLRVRDHGELARVEVDRELIGDVAAMADELDRILTDLGWTYVTVDLAGFRSGSLNDSAGGSAGPSHDAGSMGGGGTTLPLV